jgi:hypothetical protein
MISSQRDRFVLDAFYDAGPYHEVSTPTVVLRGYLLDDPPAPVLDCLRGACVPLQKLLEGSPDGLGAFNEPYATYIREKAAVISRLATESYELLRWRQKVINGPQSLDIHPAGLFWADMPKHVGMLDFGDLEWRQVPAGAIALECPLIECLSLRPEDGNKVTSLLGEGKQAPLGHILFREAWRNREANHRSALVMGVAAAETGVKEFIGRVAPETAWLVEELPSPPLYKILKDYLPMLKSTARGFETVPLIEAAWIRALQLAVEKRNMVVHGRKLELDRGWIEATLRIVCNLLYFLDYHAGNEWAQDS